MNERIYKSARLQFFMLWLITISIPTIMGIVWNQWVPNEGPLHLPTWGAVGVGVAISVILHFMLRRLFKNVYLVGTAVYNLYKKERKLERKQPKIEVLANPNDTQNINPLA